MLNILAWSDVQKHYRITADTAKENSISVHTNDGSVIKFEEVLSGFITSVQLINKNMLFNLPFITCYYMLYWYGKQCIIRSWQMDPYCIMGYIYYLVLNVVFNYLTNSDWCC